LAGAILNMNPLTDLSPMPFGMYKGSPMQDVPASYLHYLWTSGIGGRTFEASSLVAAYIRENMDALKKEYPDGIWS
jgi:uncharacterized protein (DUF3820 family)